MQVCHHRRLYGKDGIHAAVNNGLLRKAEEGRSNSFNFGQTRCLVGAMNVLGLAPVTWLFVVALEMQVGTRLACLGDTALSNGRFGGRLGRLTVALGIMAGDMTLE